MWARGGLKAGPEPGTKSFEEAAWEKLKVPIGKDCEGPDGEY